jgi:superfamily I DNA and/or RNA helicase
VWQRLNVAITRARFGLWIVGHMQTLLRDPEWSQLIQYAISKGLIVTEKEMNSSKAKQNDSHSSLGNNALSSKAAKKMIKKMSKI